MSRRARPWDGSAGMGWRAEQPPHIAAGLLFLLLVYLPGKIFVHILADLQDVVLPEKISTFPSFLPFRAISNVLSNVLYL